MADADTNNYEELNIFFHPSLDVYLVDFNTFALTERDLLELHLHVKHELRKTVNDAQIHDFNVLDIIAFGLPSFAKVPLKDDKDGRYRVIKTRGAQANADRPVPLAYAIMFAIGAVIIMAALGVLAEMSNTCAVACGAAIGLGLVMWLNEG